MTTTTRTTMQNLAGLLEDTASRYADRTALVLGEARLTYAELDALASRVANLLQSRGIGHGDKVALSCPNIPQFTAIYFGILKAGAVVVPLNVLLRGREIAYHLGDAEAKAYFCFEGSAELPSGVEGKAGFDAVASCETFLLITAGSRASVPELAEAETLGQALAGRPATFDPVPVVEDDTAVILYTSGTTGQPKGAELRHRNMLANALAGEALFDADSALPDTYLCVLPLFHSFGQTTVQNGAIAFGGTVVMLPRFEAAAAIGLMVRERVTFFAGVPTMYWGLLGAVDGPDGPVDTSDLAKQLRVAVSGGAALPAEVHRRFEERFGVTILEGYGLSDEDGWYYIVDRAKDMIIRNGFNVYPRELEEVLTTHPAVSLAAVVGVPHSQYGEEIKAFVIAEPGTEISAEELVAWGREQMAAYKYPRIVEVVSSVPPRQSEASCTQV